MPIQREPICKQAGCDKGTRGKGRGWCPMHYTRWQRHGDPEATLKKGPAKGTLYRERISYKRAHNRVKELRGKATDYFCSFCSCGVTAHHWALRWDRATEVLTDSEGLPYS